MSKEKVSDAAELFYEFTGHEPQAVDKFEKPEFPDVALLVGNCTGIMYETVRDGKKERYIHEFKKSAQPMLISSHDGKQLFLLGGNYEFKDSGINDR